jgi:hypothetical protein
MHLDKIEDPEKTKREIKEILLVYFFFLFFFNANTFSFPIK